MDHFFCIDSEIPDYFTLAQSYGCYGYFHVILMSKHASPFAD